MNPSLEIPRAALDIRYNNSGSFPHIGIHRRNGLFYQESSYAHFWFFGVMVALAGMVLLLPWETHAVVGN